MLKSCSFLASIAPLVRDIFVCHAAVGCEDELNGWTSGQSSVKHAAAAVAPSSVEPAN